MLAILREHSPLGAILRPPKRYLTSLALRWSDAIRLDRHRYHLPSPQHILWVHPNAIQLHTNWWPPGGTTPPLRDRHFHMQRHRGCVIGGDWDISPHRFAELAVHQAIQARVHHNTPWSDTVFFQECCQEIASGRVLWGCRDVVGLNHRFAQLDELIDNMRKQGYLPGFASTLKGEDPGRLSKHPQLSEEITVNVGRDGSLLFQDGRHRLAIAQALRVPAVTIKILVRHPLWCQKRLQTPATWDQEGLTGHPDLPTNPTQNTHIHPPKKIWEGKRTDFA